MMNKGPSSARRAPWVVFNPFHAKEPVTSVLRASTQTKRGLVHVPNVPMATLHKMKVLQSPRSANRAPLVVLKTKACVTTVLKVTIKTSWPKQGVNHVRMAK